MQSTIKGNDGFGYLVLSLDPRETVFTESDAMASMEQGIGLRANLLGGLIKAMLRKFIGGESAFVSQYTNESQTARTIVLSTATPGTIMQIGLNNNEFLLEAGCWLANTNGVRLDVVWAGFRSMLAGEGLFRFRVSGVGTVWIAAYGRMFEREVTGEYVVDNGHIVAFEPGLKLELGLAGGLFSSFFGGEGLVARLRGRGKIILQTRSLSGFASWLNPRLW
jgi:uncharacterized protein (TIGR00266 family)